MIIVQRQAQHAQTSSNPLSVTLYGVFARVILAACALGLRETFRIRGVIDLRRRR